jgi:hypothetical protein
MGKYQDLGGGGSHSIELTLKGFAALENEVGIQQCRRKCRPINLPDQQIFANLINSAKVRIFWCWLLLKSQQL